MTVYETLVEYVDKKLFVPAEKSMTDYGLSKIKDYLRQNVIDKYHQRFISDCETRTNLDAIDNSIRVMDNDLESKQGKWTTRFSKLLKSNGIKLTDEELGRVGDMVSAYTDKNGPWYMDMTSNLDWNDGAFGDRGSCFWASRADNRDALLLHGSLALRLFKDEDHRSGKGRAWIAKPHGIDKDLVVMFNAYGERLEKMAYLLSKSLSSNNVSLVFKMRSLRNSIDDHFWVNGSEGYVLALNESDISSRNVIDLRFCKTYGAYAWKSDKGDYPKCAKCGEIVYPTLNNPILSSSSRSITEIRNRRTRHPNLLCSNCFGTAEDMGDVLFCSGCNTFHPSDEFVEDLNGHRSCLINARYVLLCSYGHQSSVSARDIRDPQQYLNAFRSSCNSHRYESRQFTRMYGPICPTCMDLIRRYFGWTNFRLKGKSEYLKNYGVEYSRGD